MGLYAVDSLVCLTERTEIRLYAFDNGKRNTLAVSPSLATHGAKLADSSQRLVERCYTVHDHRSSSFIFREVPTLYFRMRRGNIATVPNLLPLLLSSLYPENVIHVFSQFESILH